MFSSIEYAAETNVGLKRDINEDYYGIADNQKQFPVSFIVADGLGGYAHGEIASQVTVEYCQERLNALTLADEPTMQNVLQDTIQKANVKVYLASLEDIRNTGMGSTVNIATFFENKVYAAHIGDSRFYLLREGALEALSVDHTVVQEMITAGTLTVAESKVHPERHRLTQALGVPEYLHPGYLDFDTKRNDRFLLCSDGLHGYVPEAVIAQILEEAENPQVCCKQLIEAALKEGGKDNITVACVFI